jgi:hypothetical protein
MFSFGKEFFAFLRARRKLWLTPLMLVLILLAALIVLASTTAAGPFLYTLF